MWQTNICYLLGVNFWPFSEGIYLWASAVCGNYHKVANSFYIRTPHKMEEGGLWNNGILFETLRLKVMLKLQLIFWNKTFKQGSHLLIMLRINDTLGVPELISTRGLPINRLIGLSRIFSLIGLDFGHLIFYQKIQLIFDIENWLWKYNFGTFWWTVIHRRILKKNPLSMLILG